jgi:hypothetical protein
MEDYLLRIQVLFLAAVFVSAPITAISDEALASSPAAINDSGESEAGADPAVVEASAEMAWEQFDDPDFDPAAEAEPTDVSSAPTGAVAEATGDSIDVDMEMESDAAELAHSEGIQLSGSADFEMSSGIKLGPIGVDDLGRTGRLHNVARGDTLWDLAAAYLGTPWVWPSVWIDNKDIENPHLITPGDKIWITANEMRIVTDVEAESFLKAPSEPPVGETSDSDFMGEDEIAAFEPIAEEEISPVAAFEMDDPSTLEAFPVSVVGQEPESMAPGHQITISRRDAMGFVSVEALAGATSILDSPSERTYLAAGDDVVLGMGEGDLEVGDQFTIFQAVEEVRDVETNRILGHHVDILGWLEVRELTGDTSIAEIRTSYSELRRGARVMPRPMLARHVTARSTPDSIEGKIVFLPGGRAVMADGGYVYLNRGEFHGVEIGSELEVFESGKILNDRSRRVDVRTPSHRVARLVVVSVNAETSVAFVLTSSRELEVGDSVRPQIAKLAQR